MFTKIREKLKTKVTETEDRIDKKRTERRLAKFDPDLRCNTCKQVINRGEFIAVLGKNSLLPALYAGSIKHSYAWLLGSKKYCGKCFGKEFKK